MLTNKRIKFWLDKISDDYAHYSAEEKNFLLERICPMLKITEYGNDGIMAWLGVSDVDLAKRASLIVFYVVPEKRGGSLFLRMIKDFERQAKDDGATECIVGPSISGYKEEKFNRIFSKFGYNTIYSWTKKV